MFIIYDLVFLAFVLVYLPVYLLKGKFHRGFARRLGALPGDLALDKPVWIHAVSVGEVAAAGKLIQGLRQAYPEKKFFITTVTPTGNKVARGMIRPGDCLSYLPLDFSFIVRRVIERVKPGLFILMETELWPNLITRLDKKGIPIVILNGRISDRSCAGYGRIKFLLRPLLRRIRLFCVQTKSDAQRFIRLGAPEERVKVSGNMKFDIADFGLAAIDASGLRLKLGLRDNQKLLVAASTHPGEEGMLLEVYQKLLADFPGLRLLLAPRHPERAKEIEKIVLKAGLTPLCISGLSGQAAGNEVFILDSIGELVGYYALADAVFVGGSLVKKGGHNILEPASLARPVVFGPHMFNFRDISGLFLENKAALMVSSPGQLKDELAGLLSNASRAKELGRRAEGLVSENRGATQRNLAFLEKYLS